GLTTGRSFERLQYFVDIFNRHGIVSQFLTEADELAFYRIHELDTALIFFKPGQIDIPFWRFIYAIPRTRYPGSLPLFATVANLSASRTVWPSHSCRFSPGTSMLQRCHRVSIGVRRR